MSRARLISCLVLLYAASADAASLLDPRLGFRVLTTPHFTIYFHQGTEPQAQRLGTIVEDVWQQVSTSLAHPAPPRTHVILADQTELANGWATPLPRNIIFVTTAAPTGSEFIGRTSDWLRLVVTHEFTHIAHLDRGDAWAGTLRRLFGRTPIAFPNLFLPSWQIEGLATWQESALTGEGRLHAGDFRNVVGAAAASGRLEPIDRASGGLIDWPDGFADYAYGLAFHQYLADRYGPATLARLADETARRLPFLGARAFRAVFGQPLGQLWEDYLTQLASRSVARENITDPAATVDAVTAAPAIRRLTHHGFAVTGPRFAPRCGRRTESCAAEVIYSDRNPNGFPTLRSVPLDGSPSTRIANRYLGATSGVGADVVIFDQQEWRRNVSLYSDLFALDRRSGRSHRLTREARLLDPDLSPDGQTIVAVRESRGRRELVLVPLQSAALGSAKPVRSWSIGNVTILASDPGMQFNAPRWSPDGRSVAAARRRPGVLSEIVIVDVATGIVRIVASEPSTRIVTPTWRPDGRAIVAAADYGEAAFNLYEFAAERSAAFGRRLTSIPGGASWPDVSADGQTMVFVGYTTDGFDLFTSSYPPGDVAATETASERPAPAEVPGSPLADERTTAPVQPYSPLPTLLPTSWSPMLEVGSTQLRAGLSIGGSDVLARHGYAASASWLVSGPGGAATPNRGTPDWQLLYVYDRYRPTYFVSASNDTVFGAGPADSTGRPTSATRRSLELEAGVLVPFRHVRTVHRAVASLVRTNDRYTFTDEVTLRTRSAARGGWSSSTARAFGYSIGPAEGISIGGTIERIAGSAGTGATTATIDTRGYFPGIAAHQVLALRAAGGWSDGERNAERTFHLGGARPGGDVIDFGYQAISLLRGFPSDAFAGSRVAVINADYRFPIARPQRGAGTFPLFVRTVHGAVFADTGHAWSRRFTVDDAKVAVGGELSLDLVAGYRLPLTIAAGAAWGHDGATASSGSTVYARVGRAF